MIVLTRGGSPALAGQCVADGCYNYSYAYGIPASPASYTLAWWATNFITDTSDDGTADHLSQVNWDIADGPYDTYLEIGLTAAYNSLGCSGYCSQPYWEDKDAQGNFHPHTLLSPFPFSDGVSRYYFVASDPSECADCFDLYTSPTSSISWTYQGTSSVLTASTFSQTEVGMEDHEGSGRTDYSGDQVDPDESSADFDAGLEAWDNGNWQTLTMNIPPIDYPCNGTNQGYCLNGASYGASEYSDNKP